MSFNLSKNSNEIKCPVCNQVNDDFVTNCPKCNWNLEPYPRKLGVVPQDLLNKIKAQLDWAIESFSQFQTQHREIENLKSKLDKEENNKELLVKINLLEKENQQLQNQLEQSAKAEKQFESLWEKQEEKITSLNSEIIQGNDKIKQQEAEIEKLKETTINEYKFTVKTIYSNGQASSSYQGQNIGFIENLEQGIILTMMFIPKGKFMMGAGVDLDDRSKESDEQPQHLVNVTSFYMGQYPVTQAQWLAVMRTPPTNFQGANFPVNGNLPVEEISWNEAVEFCNKLTEITRKKYRLPSEAEWEYACRAGTITRFHFGENLIPSLANYNYQSDIFSQKTKSHQQVTPVGEFKVANAFGLYDMHGNVWEWCADPLHENYYNAPKDSRVWDDDNADRKKRIYRGGAYNSDFKDCRSSSRSCQSPHDSKGFPIGFRIVCDLQNK